MIDDDNGDDVDRFVEDESSLRAISPDEGVHGENSSDYRHMYDLFLRMTRAAATLRNDPTAFVGKYGYDDKVMNAYIKMEATALKALSELNRMRNQDRMTTVILDNHTRDISEMVAIEVGRELRLLLGSLENESSVNTSELSLRLRSLLYKRLPEILITIANKSLDASKKEYGLLN